MKDGVGDFFKKGLYVTPNLVFSPKKVQVRSGLISMRGRRLHDPFKKRGGGQTQNESPKKGGGDV